ncbi:N-acetylgalactosaminyltransferase, partial [Cordylochernes scorpioides]
MVTLWCFSRRRRVYFKLVVIIIFGLFIYILYKTSRTQQYLTNQESLNSFESNQIKPRASPIKEILPRQEKLPLKQTNVPPKKTAVIYLDDKLDNLMSITPGLGEKGQPVILNKEEQKEADKLFKQAAFNVYISNRIALNRSVPDPRNSECHKVEYDSDLPQTSVIIIFTNEIWSALLRTIHSVINRTPKHLLKEIILVDDFSDKGRWAALELSPPLKTFIHTIQI